MPWFQSLNCHPAIAKKNWRRLPKRSLPERDLPEYLAVDGTTSTYVRVPTLDARRSTLDEVPNPVKMEPNLVVEFYSR